MAIAIDLEGRVVLACGVGRGGIGGAVARRLAAAGATLVMVDQTQAILDETIADVEALGGQCHGIAADLTDPSQSDGIIAAVAQRFERLDGVANVAGGTKAHEWKPLEETPTELFRDVLNLNLEYVFRICRDAAALMIRRKTPGAIVNVSSISGLAGAPFHGPYGAAKAGIAALTRTMSVEWRPYGIRANSVSPGAVATERVTSRPGWSSTSVTGSTAGYITSTDELAHAIVFLLSDLASGISGQNLVVDCGLTAKFAAGTREEMRGSIWKG
jgi:NAD(P)-dependent dehydrogenase (short-subunit alcohol dehydrogenase family)